MSTRSITTIRSKWVDDSDNEVYEWDNLATIYVHDDGYLEGVGEWLYNFLDGLTVVNGISQGTPDRYANGPGRLAAQLISAMQNDHMGPKLIPHDSEVGQEYHYQIDIIYGMAEGLINISVFDGPITFFGHGGGECVNMIFNGSVSEFRTFLDSQTEENYDEDECEE